jgi:hypothetical protein
MIKELNLYFDKSNTCHFSKSFLQLSIVKADLKMRKMLVQISHYALEIAEIFAHAMVRSSNKQIW